MMTALQHQETLDKTTKVSRESHATQSYPSHTIVHAKLEMTEPGDHDELEAEEMANAIVIGGKISRKISGGASGSSGIAVSQQMEHQLAHLQGNGRQMPEGLRNMMENGFGRDFSQVRLHTDSDAANMSSSIHAKAFTHGNDIYFNRGQFAPETAEGQHLVAHELTHVVQGTGKVGREPSETSFLGWFFHNAFIKEDSDWILDDNAHTKLINNFSFPSNSKERIPITVILYTTKKDSDKAFDQDQGTIDFVNNESRTRVLMIQGRNSLAEYSRDLALLATYYGPLQNIIVQGHGWYNRVRLGNDVQIDTSDDSDGFYETVKTLFDKADKEHGTPLPHSILLPSCLTGANTFSPNGLVNHVQCIMGSNVLVRGNKAAVTDHQKYYYSDEEQETCSDNNGYLTFIDTKDPNSPINGVNYTHIIDPADKDYSTQIDPNTGTKTLGNNAYGMLFEINLHLQKQLTNSDSREDKTPVMEYELDESIYKIRYIFPSDITSKPSILQSIKDNYSGSIEIIESSSSDPNLYLKKTFDSEAILKIIQDHITTDPKGTFSFVNSLLFNYIIVSTMNPSLEELFDKGKNLSI